MRWRFLSFPVLALIPAACSSTPDPGPPLPAPDDYFATIKEKPSCSLACDPTCAESTKPWVCPALGDWNAIPHAPECGSFDGKTFPTPQQGKCVATDPTGDALAKAQITQKPIVLPDGRRLDPAGKELLFQNDGGFPATQIRIPGTRWLAINDYGYGKQSVRVIDTDALKTGTGTPEVARITYDPPAAINWGIAYLKTKKLLFASSGVSAASVLAFDFDETTGKLTANAAKDIKLPKDTLPSGIAISPDEKVMLVGQSKDTPIFVIGLEDGNYGQQLGTIDAGGKDLYDLQFDPNDPTGNTAYATLWTTTVTFDDANVMRLLQIDVAGRSAKTIPVGKEPEQIVFLDARWAVVANSLSDTLSLVDRPAAKVALEVKVSPTNGPSPTALAWDPVKKRLYVTLAAQNAIAAFDVDTATPSIVPAGMLPTAWWPTGVSVDPSDGTLFVLNGRGHGIGNDPKPNPSLGGELDAAKRMGGSIQAIPYPDGQTLTAGTATVDKQNQVAKLDGYSKVDCKGAPYDFPIPEKPEDGASKYIKHVFFIVRENKTYDGIMGDRPGADGDPSLVLAPGKMDDIWPNAFAIAKSFVHLDNYYIDSEQSIQGHAWTVFGRSTDYTERRWLNIWGRGQFGVTSTPGVGGDTTPAEGNLFQFLDKSGITFDNQGEFVGGLQFRDPQWPGGTTDGTTPDTLSACYIAWRARVMCNSKDFSYSWLVNDHTFGFAAGRPNPALLIATNDEGTGMYVDAISHSPFWKDSLIVVVEDDPSQGADHVDIHRSIALVASPWVKRGYVSHAHYHLSSFHKLFSDIYGKPYRSTTIADAPLPIDLFTSTPDYTPFNYVPRKFQDLSCNPKGGQGSNTADGWDFTLPDNQPGLGGQVWQALHSLK